jgi:hypothetical protein
MDLAYAFAVKQDRHSPKRLALTSGAALAREPMNFYQRATID